MSDDGDEHGSSVFARKFNIPSIKSEGHARWNKEWEKVLPTLSASDVYSMLKIIWDQDKADPAEFAHQSQKVKEYACGFQSMVVKMWDEAGGNGGDFAIAWLILDEAERKRHLLKGLEETGDLVSFGQDGRALCPEITLGPMLKQQGKGFIDFMRDYSQGKKDVAEDDVYLLPNEWWQKVVNAPEPLSEADDLAYRLLTFQRNEFIGKSFDGLCR